MARCVVRGRCAGARAAHQGHGVPLGSVASRPFFCQVSLACLVVPSARLLGAILLTFLLKCAALLCFPLPVAGTPCAVVCLDCAGDPIRSKNHHRQVRSISEVRHPQAAAGESDETRGAGTCSCNARSAQLRSLIERTALPAARASLAFLPIAPSTREGRPRSHGYANLESDPHAGHSNFPLGAPQTPQTQIRHDRLWSLSQDWAFHSTYSGETFLDSDPSVEITKAGENLQNAVTPRAPAERRSRIPRSGTPNQSPASVAATAPPKLPCSRLDTVPFRLIQLPNER
jgi:hypothetical protein